MSTSTLPSTACTPPADRDWSADPQENAVVAAGRTALRALAATLYDVAETRYVKPAGGFAVDR